MTGHEADAHTPAPPPGCDLIATPHGLAFACSPQEDFGAGLAAPAPAGDELELSETIDDLRAALAEERGVNETLRSRLLELDAEAVRAREAAEDFAGRLRSSIDETTRLWAAVVDGTVKNVHPRFLRRIILVALGHDSGAERPQ